METDYKTTYIAGEKENVSDLKRGDIVYCRRQERGYSVVYELAFIKYEKGLVHGIALRETFNGNRWEGLYSKEEMKVRRSKCFLWGVRPDERIKKVYSLVEESMYDFGGGEVEQCKKNLKEVSSILKEVMSSPLEPQRAMCNWL